MKAPRGFLECGSRWRLATRLNSGCRHKDSLGSKGFPAQAVAQVAGIEDRENSDRCCRHQRSENKLRLRGCAGQGKRLILSAKRLELLKREPVTNLEAGLQRGKQDVGLHPSLF